MNTYEYSVIPESIDSNGRMTVPSICCNVINAIGQNIKKEGYGIDVMLSNNRSWILVRSAFEIDARPDLYSPMYIEVWPAPTQSLTHNRCVRITDNVGRELGRGTTEWCMIDVSTRKPIFPNLEMEGTAADVPCRSPRRIRDLVPEIVCRRKVYSSDCDYNRHMTNMRYLDMFYDMLPDDVIDSCSPVRLDLNYRHEVKCGTDISTGIRNDNHGEWLFIAKDGDQTLCTASLLKA